ncbi:heteroglycan glucosidase 1 [Tanacetum coccineum]
MGHTILSNHIPSYIPTCEYIAEQQVVYCELPAGTSLYGTGEVSGQLERTGKRVFTWNTDAWWYGSGTASLYQSHPWVLAVLPNGDAFGILADTTTRCEIDLRKESIVKFTATPTFPVITFGPFASANVVLTSLSHAIGTVFMPPKWALGYHQCRWSYDSDMRVREIAKTFREKRIPCDVIWMDVDHTDGFRTFTFDQENFPSPKSLADDLHGIGFKGIWMVEPGIKCEKGYFVYDTGSENDVWVQTKDGEPFVGNVWPGPCVFPDYTQEKARSWWANLVKDHISNGVDGVWNDMNEPSTTTMPESNIHRGDAELGGHQNHSHYHNVYGMLMARATYDGMKLADPNKRPFVLTRAGFIGSQRYAATWTGDNFSTWVHLHMSISMVLQLGLSGQPLSGPDIGGFDGNATPKLFGRWFGIGAMFPFARGHSQKETVDHEPWSFGEECEEVCRLALKRRYRLMPHIYTLFYLAHTQGSLVASPTFFADSKDPRLRTNENSFLLGPLLVYASTTSDLGIHELKHELPSGLWLSFDFEDSHPDLPALYLRGGSIIPFGPAHQHVGEANPDDDLSLLVALDENGNDLWPLYSGLFDFSLLICKYNAQVVTAGKAEGVMFEDDGESYEYINGVYLLTTYVAELRSSVITVRVSKTEGLWKRPNRRLHVHILLGEGAMVDEWGIDGEVMQIPMPSETEVSKLISSSKNNYKIRMETAKLIPDVDKLSALSLTGIDVLVSPAEVKYGEWALKVVPWIGGRIISLEHIPTGIHWLRSRIEISGYEEYSGTEYRSAGCTEEYVVIDRDLAQVGQIDSLKMEGDVGGGLAIQRNISILKDNPKVFKIDSSLVARNVGDGPEAYSRVACLRIHPTFSLTHPTESYVSFTSINGSKHDLWPESGERFFEGDFRPNGEWMLVDKCLGLGLLNKFSIDQVNKCLVTWDFGTANLELWSEERPVSKQSPLCISHTYEIRQL